MDEFLDVQLMFLVDGGWTTSHFMEDRPPGSHRVYCHTSWPIFWSYQHSWNHHKEPHYGRPGKSSTFWACLSIGSAKTRNSESIPQCTSRSGESLVQQSKQKCSHVLNWGMLTFAPRLNIAVRTSSMIPILSHSKARPISPTQSAEKQWTSPFKEAWYRLAKA